MVKTRFAPSPTGRLHVGNIRVALLNYLFTKKHGGHFMLRMDDTDAERSTEAFAEGIKQDMQWLGMEWDSTDAQSNQQARYDAAIEKLKTDGRLYPCYETPEDLDLKRRALLNQGKPPIYDRASLNLSEQEKQDLEAQGITPHWRFKLNHEDITWTDLVRGDAHFHGSKLSDPVLIRANGRPIYTLSSVVDDITFDITHVIRGEDHITNTASQIQVCEALGGTPPSYIHLPLLQDAEGKGLSKRLGSASIEGLRDEGYEPMAISSLLTKLGTPDAIQAYASLDALIANFDITRYSTSTPKLDMREMESLNADLLHATPYETVRPALSALGLETIDASFWKAIQPNLTFLKDAKEWWQVCREPLTPMIAGEDKDFIQQASRLLPTAPWTHETWGQFVDTVKQATGRKGKGLFMPLRKALTGMEHGPELAHMLLLVGYDRAKARLQGNTA